jgi:hypothetical protein
MKNQTEILSECLKILNKIAWGFDISSEGCMNDPRRLNRSDMMRLAVDTLNSFDEKGLEYKNEKQK